MSIALTLLADVRWRGRPVAGDRPQALLAALAARDCRPVRPEELIELVWGEDAPSNGPKSLQVLVSRARTACGADVIVRDGAGYRLGGYAGRGRQHQARGARPGRRGRARPGRGRRTGDPGPGLQPGGCARGRPAGPRAGAAQSPQDEPLLANLLRSEAAVSGPATALERFERYAGTCAAGSARIPVSSCSARTAACSRWTAPFAGECVTTRPS